MLKKRYPWNDCLEKKKAINISKYWQLWNRIIKFESYLHISGIIGINYELQFLEMIVIEARVVVNLSWRHYFMMWSHSLCTFYRYWYWKRFILSHSFDKVNVFQWEKNPSRYYLSTGITGSQKHTHARKRSKSWTPFTETTEPSE